MDSATATLLGIMFSGLSVSEARDSIRHELITLYPHIRYFPGRLDPYILELNNTYRQMHNILSPILDLPPNITVKVLEMAYDDIYDEQGTNGRHFHPVQRVLDLGFVCRTWRHLTITTPKFWTVIRLDHMGIVPLLLERSSNLPLEVVFTGLDNIFAGPLPDFDSSGDSKANVKGTGGNPTESTGVWRLLALHSHRITSLRCQIPDIHKANRLLSDYAYLWKNLKELHVQGDRWRQVVVQNRDRCLLQLEQFNPERPELE